MAFVQRKSYVLGQNKFEFLRSTIAEVIFESQNEKCYFHRTFFAAIIMTMNAAVTQVNYSVIPR